MNFSRYVLTLTLALVLGLTACGGGGGGDASGALPSSTSSANISSVPVTIPVGSYAPTSAELGGWTVLQTARVLCGFGALRQDARLDAAALNHARYLTSESMATGTSLLSHFETNTANPSYTGYLPWDRTDFTPLGTDYGTQVAEILLGISGGYDTSMVIPTLEQRGTESMRSLLNTVYHLSGAMYDGADVGFGAELRTKSTGATTVHEEFRFGSLNGFQTHYLSLGAGQVATYPCQNSANVPPAFAPAFEAPNPFPAMTSPSQTVGPPIYLKADAGQVLTLTSSSVSSAGVAVSTTWLTHANDPARDAQNHPYIDLNEVFVVPNNPLRANTSYQVQLTGNVDGTPFNRIFTMTTGQ